VAVCCRDGMKRINVVYGQSFGFMVWNLAVRTMTINPLKTKRICFM
jgi:hypothetical protein